MRFQTEKGYAVSEDALIKQYEESKDFGDDVSFLEWLKKQGYLLPKPREAN